MDLRELHGRDWRVWLVQSHDFPVMEAASVRLSVYELITREGRLTVCLSVSLLTAASMCVCDGKSVLLFVWRCFCVFRVNVTLFMLRTLTLYDPYTN